MKTNEKLKIALLQETEKELLKMIDQFETIREGDLQSLEQSVLRGCLSLGRTMLEQILNHTAEEAQRPSRREGACGQKPRLVGIRPKQLHTLMGKVTIRRAYYQCVVGTDRRTNQSRSTKTAGKTCLSFDTLRGSGHLNFRLAAPDVRETSPQSDPTARRSLERAGRRAGAGPL